MQKLKKWFANALMAWGLFALYAVISYSPSDYHKPEREVQCINSACESVCKQGAKFVRHQGCSLNASGGTTGVVNP